MCLTNLPFTVSVTGLKGNEIKRNSRRPALSISAVNTLAKTEVRGAAPKRRNTRLKGGRIEGDGRRYDMRRREEKPGGSADLSSNDPAAAPNIHSLLLAAHC